ncbi:flagellar basal body P-ring formation chaperone FlgA [Rhodopirellula sp. SWK7]|uniref:flagellar basal body P-ring formation chaperone FlgA n=1 Tax=Rhodopirellula sp. SWK7 TaxID=595460 RepID=UPI0002BD5288|nr:flagellar basal body P-ring formation chaperone FlgA [Rhodopirellula sp. SWK7]EMI41853.1 LfgA (potential lateral flagellar protein FlgA) [Rhodopirellula sp. SWK7]
MYRSLPALARQLMQPESIAACAASLLFLLAMVFGASPAHGQSPLDNEVTTPLYSSHRGSVSIVPNVSAESNDSSPRVGTIDANTRWQFVTREDVSITGSIIRLQDVIRPLESNLVAWQRLAESTIGLMPADGSDAKISRDRLADLISRAAATPGRIKIYGPETILIRHSRRATEANAPKILRTGFASQSDVDGSEVSTVAATDNDMEAARPVDPDVLERIQQYILAIIRNQYRDLHEGFDIDIQFDPAQLALLSETQGIRHLSFPGDVPVWSNKLTDPIEIEVRVHGRAVGEDCQGIARLILTPYPGVVTARQSLRRGQRVTRSDLQYRPYSAEGISLPDDVVLYPEDIIDMEVVGLVRGNVPLFQSAFAAPRVIRRGDLLEVQVGGGGIRVTTGAKSLSDGAVGELIEIETISPKRRLLAKVVHSSLVEVMTQAPQVRSERSTPSNATAQR